MEGHGSPGGGGSPPIPLPACATPRRPLGAGGDGFLSAGALAAGGGAVRRGAERGGKSPTARCVDLENFKWGRGEGGV